MSTPKKPTPTKQISSFDSPYVSLDLVPYMKSGQIMPFHVFNRSVMPDFLRQLSHGRANFPGPDDGRDDATAAAAGDSPLQLLNNIKDDMAHIRNACRRLEVWESDVSIAIYQLVLQCIDDAYKVTMEADAENADTEVQRNKLLRIRDRVSELKKHVFGPLKLVLDKNSKSFKLSILSLARLRGSGGEVMEDFSPYRDLDSVRENGEQKFLEIQEVYDGLSDTAKRCLLCFSVFPENEDIKRKVLAHWWIGEGFIGDDAATTAGDLFREFAEKGLIELVHKKQRPSADSCKMDPSVRYAVIKIAESQKFAQFDEGKTRPTANSSASQRPCLVRGNANEEPGSSAREFESSYASKQENVRTLFNVSEVQLEFNPRWFSKMKNAKVLQLGKWQSSGPSNNIVQVDSSEFLKGLRRMKHLRYLSLRGISRIAELPSSVCKLSSLKILNLNGCHDLQTLPEGIGSLKKLTHLDMNECYFISHMPKGISKLSELQILKGFVIGKTRPGFESQHCQLEDLTKLKKLTKLNIHVDRNLSNARTELGCLENMESLESLSVSWSRIYYSSSGPKGVKRVISQVKRMASLPGSPMRERKSPASTRGSKAMQNKLPKKLRKLDLHYFPSEKLSDWFSLERIQRLKKLYVREGDLLNDLTMSGEGSCWRTVEFLRFKLLRKLAMNWEELRKLFPQLVYLETFECPNLSSFPCDESGIWKKPITD